MKALTIAKLLDYLAMIGIVVIVFFYVFFHIKFPTMAISLLGVCVLKMLGAIIKANFYEKDNKALHDENDNYKQTVEELRNELNNK
jgi:hypothetical protein